jgi:hypothetical protein
MDSLRRATEDLEKVEATIARLEDQLRRAQEDATKIRHFIEVARRYSGEELAPSATRPRHRVGSKTKLFGDLSVEAIRERGLAMTTVELLHLIEGRGEVVGGQNKINTLSGILSRDGRLRSIRGLGWRLADEPSAVHDEDVHSDEVVSESSADEDDSSWHNLRRVATAVG